MMSSEMSDSSTIILNLDQQPFESFELAATMRDLLMAESVYRYQVALFDTDNESAGFIVRRIQKEQGPQAFPPQQEDRAAKQIQKNNRQASPNKQVIKRIYHPALRTYVLTIPLAFAGLILVLFAVELWVIILSVVGLNDLPAGIDSGMVVTLTQMVGSLLVGWLLIAVLINYYGTTLRIDDRGITYTRGIISQDVTNVRFAEIRTIGLRQGILDRLLNIGILEFASSGTDDVDIRFINIVNPARVKLEIEAMIEQQISR